MIKVSVVPSALAGVSKVFRLRCLISGRINRLCKYFRYVVNGDDSYLEAVNADISILSALLYRLDTNSVVCNTYFEVLRSWQEFPASFEDHCIRLFGSFIKSKYDPRAKLNQLKLSNARPEVIKNEEFSVNMIEGMLHTFEEGTRFGRKSELMRRLKLEIDQRSQEGWYFVFNTLTVRPGCMSKVFPTDGGSSVWTDYVRSVDRYFGEAAYGSFRAAKGKEYHTYFAVVEKGSQTGRLHIHVLHAFRSMPRDFIDPNLGSVQPYNREITALKRFWHYGNSSPIGVRFSQFDAFGSAGWRWPVVQKDSGYEVLVAKPFGAIVNYIGKYVTKAYIDKEPGCIWRTRSSRKLGVKPLKVIVKSMPLKLRLYLVKAPRLSLSLRLTRLPRYLLRRLLLKSLPVTILVQLFKRALLIPRTSLLARWRSMIQGILVYSPQNVGDYRLSMPVLKAVSEYFPIINYSMALAGPT